MTLPGLTVRKMPLNFCAIHHQDGVWAEDGTDAWVCPACIDDALYVAEKTLRLDREIHRANHRRISPVSTCLYCNPGLVA